MMRIVKWFLAFLIVAALLLGCAGVYLCEGVLHLPRKPVNMNFPINNAFANQYRSRLETVEIVSKDNLRLRAWYLHLNYPSKGEVLLVHGQGDNRNGMIAYARLFLSQGYNVLLPDMRAHGLSEGELITYGLNEAWDIHLWVNWLIERTKVRCVYGLGESMGAAILLQSLNVEKRFCAMVAESSYSSFEEIGYDRALSVAKWGPFGRLLLAPAIKSALIYAYLRYGVDLQLVNAENAVKESRTPIFLIHGMNDKIVPSSHSDRLLKAATGPIQLWKVPDTRHSGAISKSTSEFARRVLSWFQSHS